MDKEVNQESNGSSRALTTKTPTLDANSFNAVNLFDEKELVAAESFLKRMIATDKGGFKTVNEGLAILMRAKDLQLPFSSCIEHIHVISGKTGVDVHIIKSLLLRAGVTWECTKDYAPQYNYTDGNTIYNDTLLPEYCIRCRNAKEAEERTNDDVIGVYPLAYYVDLKGNVFNELELNDKCVKAINKIQALKYTQEGKYPVVRIPAQPIDYVTEYKFTRYRVINGKERITNATSHFSFTDAQKADLFKKETYQKYPRTLIAHRAFTLGARDIADDALMGVYETTELKIMNNMDIDDADIVYAEEV